MTQQYSGLYPKKESTVSEQEQSALQQDSFAQWVPGVRPLHFTQHAIHTKKSRHNHRMPLYNRCATTTPSYYTYQDPQKDIPYFCRNGVNKKTLRQLRRGHWSIARIIDFHGLDRFAARELFETAILQTQAQGMRCVHCIHGKGLRSPAGPVLKSYVRAWLIHHAQVLAFCDAPPSLGGHGATLVLLRTATFLKNGS